MDSLFVRCLEEDGYKRQPTSLIVGVSQRPEVLIIVSPGLLALNEDYRHLYFVANRSPTAREFFFQSPVL